MGPRLSPYAPSHEESSQSGSEEAVNRGEGRPRSQRTSAHWRLSCIPISDEEAWTQRSSATCLSGHEKTVFLVKVQLCWAACLLIPTSNNWGASGRYQGKLRSPSCQWETCPTPTHIHTLLRTLESPLDCKEIQPVHPKGNQS